MKKSKIYLTIILIVLIGSIVAYYLNIAMGFGNAIPKMVKGIHETNRQWKSNGENPIDTLKTVILKEIDSSDIKRSNVEKKKNRQINNGSN